MSKISKLTKAQENLIPEYRDAYTKIGLSTEPSNKSIAESAIKRIYTDLKLSEPIVIWRDSPYSGLMLAAALMAHPNGETEMVEKLFLTLPETTKQEKQNALDQLSYGSFSAHWLSYYAFISEQLVDKKIELVQNLKDLAKNCCAYWALSKVVILIEKPTKIIVQDGKLHSTEEKALQYKDQTGVYIINGKVVPSLLEALTETIIDEA